MEKNKMGSQGENREGRRHYQGMTPIRAVRVVGRLDAMRLSDSLAALHRLHPALRIRQGEESRRGSSAIGDEGPLSPSLTVLDAPETPEALERAAEDLRQAVRSEDRNWDALLLRHDQNRHTLVFCFRRSAIDEDSLPAIAADMSRYYEYRDKADVDAKAGTAPLEPLPAGSGETETASYFPQDPSGPEPASGFPRRIRPEVPAAVDPGPLASMDWKMTADFVKAKAMDWGLDPFLVEAAAAAYVLAQYCGQARYTVMMPRQLRSESMKRCIGNCTPLVPVAFDAGAGSTFESLARAFGDSYALASRIAPAYPSPPGGEGASPRDPSPFINIAFERDAEFLPVFSGCASDAIPLSSSPRPMELAVRIGPSSLKIDYAWEIIEGSAVLSFGRSIVAFMEAAMREPLRPLSQLPILGEDDRRLLAEEANRTAEPEFLASDLYDIVSRHCTESNTKAAIADAGKEISYSQLKGIVDDISAMIAGSGARPAEAIGICLPRSAEMIAAMIATLRCGCAYLPLDPGFPAERLGYMVKHSGIERVISVSGLSGALPHPGLLRIELDHPQKKLAAPPPVPVSPDTPAYIIYTSGSTGNPKGVVVPRKALANLLSSMLRRPGITSDDVLCAVTTLSFDIAELELLAPLCAGGKVVVASAEETGNPKALSALLKKSGATLMQATPMTWQMLLETQWEGNADLKALCGGEALTSNLAAALRPKVKSLWNMYGPTETTVWSTCCRIDDPQAPISIGKPIGNTAVYVLDEHHRPLPAGVEGQLFIGGAGVALGYFRADDLTATRFFADPFRPGGRMYDTGDRAKITEDGSLFILGRNDFQVKLRGYRIELGEIEVRLESMSGISKVVAVLRRDDPENPEITAYYTLHDNAMEPTPAEMREHCAKALPNYMIPSRFQRLVSFPTTPNGKIDRKALPPPGGAGRPPLATPELDHRPKASRQTPSGPADVDPSEMQKQLFLADRLHPGCALNTITRMIRIEGELDANRLVAAFDALRRRNMSLRLRLRFDDDGNIRAAAGATAAEAALDRTDSPDSPDALNRAVEELRKGIKPGERPWDARLLRHGPYLWTLIVCAHRCVLDEASFQALGTQLTQLYSSRLLNDDEKGNVISRADVSSPEDGPRRIAAWLAGLPPLNGFPLKAVRPRFMAIDAGFEDAELDVSTASAAGDLANRCGSNPFLTLAAGAMYVIAQYCGQSRIAVGLPYDLRPENRRDSIGSFSSMIPLAFDSGAGGSFRRLAEAFSASYYAARPFAETSFQSIVKECGVKAEPSANPVYQIAIEPSVPFSLDIPGCQCRPMATSAAPQQLDLFLQISPDSIRISYASKIIASSTVKALHRSIRAFLEAALREPEKPLSELPVIGEDDRRFLIDHVNKTEEPAFLAVDLYDLVTGHFPDSCDRTAIECAGRSVSYADLKSVVEGIAGQLAHAGAGTGGVVGICLQRSVEMVAAMLAVMRSGNAYLPLDPAFPHERLGYMVEHSGLELIITTSQFRGIAGKEGIRLIELDGERDAEPIPPPARVSAESPAYVLYTSGSTGMPKGVVIPRRALANLLASMIRRLNLRSEDTWCAITTFSFDIAEMELLGPLCVGGKVSIALEDNSHDPFRLAAFLRESKATVLQATPTTWQLLCASGWSGDKGLLASCTGEAMPPALSRSLAPKVRELWNLYGPTETTVWSTFWRVDDPQAPISIGSPIENTFVYVLDEHYRPLPPGVEGELFVGGVGVALGYLNAPDLTAQRFLPDPFRPGHKMYDTGDRAKFNDDGLLFVVGRSDFQVKLHGYRIELGEIESCLESFADIAQAAASLRRDDPENPEIIAYYTLKPEALEVSAASLREHCARSLPVYMVPSRFQRIDAFPTTPNGKIDRKALPAPKAQPTRQSTDSAAPAGDIESVLIQIWRDVLSAKTIGENEGFFEVGGNSITAFSVTQEIGRRFGMEIPVLRLFEYPTVATFAQFLKGMSEKTALVREARARAEARRRPEGSETAFDVAVIGASGRFPGAANLEELWRVLEEGRDTTTTFEREELDPLVPAADRSDPSYIPIRGVLSDIDMFDADFFGIAPSEAELMDPQQRFFLELAWEAFENSGYIGEKFPGLVGVWASKGNDLYYAYHVLTRPDKLAITGRIAPEIGNEKDHIALRVSHKLNLTGPSLSVHTACSSSLVTIENACQALISHQVDMALAGAVEIRTPHRSGQRHEEGGIFSDDGHCRPFDAKATGTMFGEGAGAVVLRRLDDALRDNDTILAIIKGVSVNNDGGNKVSYVAPSVEGQARNIASAIELSRVPPDTISFVEAHGTGTPIGDPIEVEALTRVFKAYTQRKGYCAIGSIKSNFGHPVTASGIAGLLKVVLAFKHGIIPPTVHYVEPNPKIDFDNSPFYVNPSAIGWKAEGDFPRRALIGSLGYGGTNAHAVLEEPPTRTAPAKPSRPMDLFLVSAKTPQALAAAAEQLGRFISGASPGSLADAAFTTQVGRKRFEHRRCAVAATAEEASLAIGQASGPRSISVVAETEAPPLVFMFPGQGAQYVNMGSRIYRNEPLFAGAVDQCAEILAPHLGCELREFLFPSPDSRVEAVQSLNDTYYTQPAIFTISYALAVTLKSWGIVPEAFIGHSIGEFVAATLSGVMQLEDALRLIAARGRLMHSLPAGGMLTVRLSADEVAKRLPPGLDIAADNSPKLSVVAGPLEAIRDFAAELEADGIANKTLHTSHAFHSAMMDPIIEEFKDVVAGIRLSAPKIPIASTLTGEWMRPEEATDPSYWARHLRSRVRFSKALSLLMEDSRRVFVECGPRRTCASLALQHRPAKPSAVIATMPDSAEPDDEYPSLLLSLGALWANGADIDWAEFHKGEDRRRVPLPTYPFQRKRFWIEPGDLSSFGIDAATAKVVSPSQSNGDKADTPDRVNISRRTGDEPLSAIVSIIEESLGTRLESFDPDARFMELGLDSLLMTQVALRIRKDLGLNVTFRQLSERYSTPRLLADAVKEAGRSVAERIAGKSAPEPEHAMECPSTPGQREMWFSAYTGSGATCAYNESVSLRFRGEIDENALISAMNALPGFHEALRGRFSRDGSSFIIDQDFKLEIKRRDISILGPAEQEAEIAAMEKKEAETPYDLGRGPLFHAAVVRLAERELAAMLCTHHSVCDGTSQDVLVSDLSRLYESFAEGTPLPSPPEHGFSEYAAYCVSADHQEREKLDLAFWKRRFAVLPPPLDLPADGTRPPVRSFAARYSGPIIPRNIVDAAKDFARSRAVSVFTVLLSAYAAVIHRLSGAGDFVIGIPLAGHLDAGMADCVGHLVNLVPIRINIGSGTTFESLCGSVNAEVLDARDHASIGFGELVAELGIQRDRARVPLVPVVFTYGRLLPREKMRFGACDVDFRYAPRSFETFEMYVNAAESPKGLEITSFANADLYSQLWLDDRLAEFAAAIETGCREPNLVIGDAAYAREHLVGVKEKANTPLDIERKVFAIWAKHLKREGFSVDDNFFDIGGNSFLSVRIAMDIEDTFSRDFSPPTLFQYPTVSSIARFLSDPGDNPEDGGKEKIAQRARMQRETLKRLSK